MNLTLEKAITLVIVAAFIAISVNSLMKVSEPITREKAIEISKKSAFLKEAFVFIYYTFGSSRASVRGIAAYYHNSVWEIVWMFGRGVEPLRIIVFIDAETGIIVNEEWGTG